MFTSSLFVHASMLVVVVYSFNVKVSFSSVSLWSKSLRLVSMMKEYHPIALDVLTNNVPSQPSPILSPNNLRNKYYGLRHGESEANVEGVISSNPTVGCTRHGLTAKGITQSRESAVELINKIGRENLLKTVFISSDFTRAKQTAHEAIAALNNILGFEDGSRANPPHWNVHLNALLRERFFGELDAQPLIFYNWVWPLDLIDATNKRHEVESIVDVQSRVSTLIR